MRTDAVKILFVHYGDDWLAGSEIALLEMIRGLRAQGVAPFLWCNAPALENAAIAAGIPVWRDPFAYYFDYSSPAFSLSAYRLGKASRTFRLRGQTEFYRRTGVKLNCVFSIDCRDDAASLGRDVREIFAVGMTDFVICN